ncbi:hypothetical protein GCM10025857_04590 [Alicyclobacillus contaminans]|nr:hypothetical protein GCM10025857_04590 [Alicyclobacillus contaminans]
MLRSIPVTHVPGVGQAKQRCLAELGIETVHDLLHYFPRRYEDRRPRPLEAFGPSERVTVRAVVEGDAQVRWHGKKSVCLATLRVDYRQRVRGMWFNQHYLKPKLTDGRIVTVTGRYDPDRQTLVISHTDFGGGRRRMAWCRCTRAARRWVPRNCRVSSGKRWNAMRINWRSCCRTT